MFAFFWFARLNRLGRELSFQDLHARLLIAADDQLPLLVQPRRIEVELADGLCFRVELGIVTVEPVNAPMRFEIGVVQSPPDRGTAHLPVMDIVNDGRRQIVEAPASGRTLMVGRGLSSRVDHVQAFLRGKKPSVGPTAGHPATRRGPFPDSDSATGPQSVDDNQVPQRSAGCKAGRDQQRAKPNDSEIPEPVASTKLVPVTQAWHALPGTEQSGEQEEKPWETSVSRIS